MPHEIMENVQVVITLSRFDEQKNYNQFVDGGEFGAIPAKRVVVIGAHRDPEWNLAQANGLFCTLF